MVHKEEKQPNQYATALRAREVAKTAVNPPDQAFSAWWTVCEREDHDLLLSNSRERRGISVLKEVAS